MQLPQLRGWLDPELVDEYRTGGTVARKRLRLTTSPILSQHQLTMQPLAIRVLPHEALQLPEDLGVPTQQHLSGDPFLKRGGTQLAQPRDLRLRERLVLEVGQDRAAPQRQRLAERRHRLLQASRRDQRPALSDQALALSRIQLIGSDLQQVAAGRCDQALFASVRSAGGKNVAQPRHVHVQPFGAARRGCTRPQLLHQPITRDDLVWPQQQQREQRSRHPPGDGDLTSIVTEHL